MMRFFSRVAAILLYRPAAAFVVPSARICLIDILRAADEKQAVEEQTKVTFQSPKFKVYIEDTDAYGVIYNSNYVRAFERALLQYGTITGKKDDETTPSNKKLILSSIHNQKFRSSPALGEEYIIRGERIHDDTWKVEMVTENDSGIVVHNTACIGMTSAISSLSSSDVTLNQNGKIDEKRYTPYHDEFDHYSFDPITSQYGYYIPIRNAMNFFERSRSDFLGGPDALRKMQVEDDLIWVVTAVENGRLFLLDENVQSAYSSEDVSVGEFRPEDAMQPLTSRISTCGVAPGKEVIVQTTFDVKSKGMILDCHHTIWMEDSGKKKLLAQATCVIVALKGSTRRPTSKLPQWVLDKFE